ncbi:AAA family ATPase [Chitinophaga sp. CF418]|uniref:AAA family ATPase n=1 Tax=Chitinophaga sp. CF418 TaxID=1855287 RepID=UPI0009227272|nr:AAA family ATPase [Chitinophaga sp. CF418]SHN45726.1 AAA domain-containing protein, putative AbiEii toxin, Type IV TA system [Chitinophaga sp. CF418]
MKLDSLYIKNYKILNEFSIDFNKEISILIGINGSGKSSILEAIAHIFSYALLGNKSKFGFKLNYKLRLEEMISTTSTTGHFKTDYVDVEIAAPDEGSGLTYKVSFVDSASNMVITLEERGEIEQRFHKFENILPSNVVVYYSGLSETMKDIVAPHNRELSKRYRDGNTTGATPLLYFEPAIFDLILISLLSFEFGDIPIFLLEKAKIGRALSIQIKLKRPKWAQKRKIDNWWGAEGEIKAFLDYLNDQASSSSDIPSDAAEGDIVIETVGNEALIISIIGQEKLFQIRDYLGEEKRLFKILYILYVDGFWDNASFSLQNTDNNSFTVFSEGEQQAIIVKGLTELVAGQNTLFLFDEPDTYLHPAWQRMFIESIIHFNEQGGLSSSQFVIATHSPQLLGNANPIKAEVQIMEDAKIVKFTPRHYGRDISTILYEMMGVEGRNIDIAKDLSILFNLIEDEDKEAAKRKFAEMAALLGDDDPVIVRAKVQLDFLDEINETDN